MWKMIKFLLFIAALAVAFLAVTDYKIGGKTLKEHLRPFTDKGLIKEGSRDIRTLLGEGLKAAGSALSEDVTNDDRKQLEGLLKKEMEKGEPVELPKGQETLPPKFKGPQKAEPQPAKK